MRDDLCQRLLFCLFMSHFAYLLIDLDFCITMFILGGTVSLFFVDIGYNSWVYPLMLHKANSTPELLFSFDTA